MNADRFEATYLIETPLAPARVAEVMAGEQSCGTFTRVEGETDELRRRARATVEQIDELEPVGRGLYGGTVGYFGSGGDMDQAITIRTMVFSDGRYNYQAGAGIVAQSIGAREHDEILAKSEVLRRSMELAEGGL